MTINNIELALGTNLGDKENNLLRALDLIEKNIGNIIFQSKIIQTEPWGYHSENEFLNMIIKVVTAKSPIQLLTEIKNIEKLIGRKQRTNENSYEDRLIDIDILQFNKIKFISNALIIPHLKINERFFFNLKTFEV